MTDYDRPIGVADEQPHEPSAESGWQESSRLVFFDQQRGIRGIIAGAASPNSGRGSALVGIFRHDRPLFVLDTPELALESRTTDLTSVGPLSFTCLDPFARWRVDCEAPTLQIQMDWRSTHRAYDWSWGEFARSRHYEQPGRVHGRITIADETYEIDGWAQRERAWGEPLRDGIQFAWASRVIFGAESSQHAAVLISGKRTYLFGYRIVDGRAQMIDRLHLAPSYAYPGGPPLSTELRAWCGDELIADQQIRLANVIPHFSVDDGIETHEFQTFSEWFEGHDSCVGQLEHRWSIPMHTGGVIDVCGNDGTWVET